MNNGLKGMTGSNGRRQFSISGRLLAGAHQEESFEEFSARWVLFSFGDEYGEVEVEVEVEVGVMVLRRKLGAQTGAELFGQEDNVFGIWDREEEWERKEEG